MMVLKMNVLSVVYFAVKTLASEKLDLVCSWDLDCPNFSKCLDRSPFCPKGVCVCHPGYYAAPNAQGFHFRACWPYPRVGESCRGRANVPNPNQDFDLPPGYVCDTNGFVACHARDYTQLPGGICGKGSHGHFCSNGSQCKQGLACSADGVCVCLQNTNMIHDEKHGVCRFRDYDDDCSTDAQCQMGSFQGSNQFFVPPSMTCSVFSKTCICASGYRALGKTKEFGGRRSMACVDKTQVSQFLYEGDRCDGTIQTASNPNHAQSSQTPAIHVCGRGLYCHTCPTSSSFKVDAKFCVKSKANYTTIELIRILVLSLVSLNLSTTS